MAITVSDITANADIREKIFSICDIDIVVDASEGAGTTIDAPVHTTRRKAEIRARMLHA